MLTEKETQKELYGAAKARAAAIVRDAEERFNLKTPVIEANLKRVGILFERVGSICKYKKFRNGVLVDSSSKDIKNDILLNDEVESEGST